MRGRLLMGKLFDVELLLEILSNRKKSALTNMNMCHTTPVNVLHTYYNDYDFQ